MVGANIADGTAVDYSSTQALLPFVARFVQARSPFRRVSVELVRDGSLRVRLVHRGVSLSVLWSEASRGAALEASFQGVVVSVERPRAARSTRQRDCLEMAARHVAVRLARLLRGNPPHLLQWRNRNLERLYWGTRMFERLCPGLLVPGHTRYYDYTLVRIDEYEGFLNVEFRRRAATVVLRLVPAGAADVRPLASWGPISMVVARDERRREERCRPEHRVEEFLGYLLSRNLPRQFELEFERNDPPGNLLPAGLQTGFLRSSELDDSAFFEMLLATAEDVGVVTSCDRECFNLFSLVASSREDRAVNTPWQLRPSPGYLEHCYNTGLDGRSTVLGSDSLERCLEGVRTTARPPRLVVLVDSCLHRLIGADIDGAVARFRRRGSLPLVHYPIRGTPDPRLGQVRDFWKDVLTELARSRTRVRSRRVAFLGLGPDAMDELSRALEELGVESGARLFPQLRVDDVRRLPSCALVVINEWDYVRTIFADMVHVLGRPAVALPLPYGIGGTTRWLEGVAAAARAEAASVSGVDRVRRLRDDFAQELAAARRRAGDTRIAVVVRWLDGRFDAVEQLAPRRRFGIPLVEFFHELGMGIDLNLIADPLDEPDPCAIAQALGLRSDAGDSVTVLRSGEELPGRLERGDFALVYTEAFHDTRITAAGKTPLHVSQLRAGYLGAVQTARLVHGLLRSSFPARYRRYLAPPSVPAPPGKRA